MGSWPVVASPGRAATLALLLGVGPMAAAPAGAAILSVTDCRDTGGPGQLRTQVGLASPGDTILLPACAVTLGGAPLIVNKTLNLQGAGTIRTAVSGNHASQVLVIGAPARVVTLADLWVRDGKAAGPGGAILTTDPGTLLLLRDVQVSGSEATHGGAIFGSGPVLLLDSPIASNTASSSGGGLVSTGPLTMVGSSASGNRVTAVPSDGGGLVAAAGATLVNSTVSGNTATRAGGGILVTGGSLTLLSSTIANNHATVAGGGVMRGGGTVDLHGTIVAGNTAASGANCEPAGGGIVSAGHNLASDGSCGLTGPGDLPDTDPRLEPLRDNGGSADSHALRAGSPALDAGDPLGCPGVDQRGLPRPQGAGCDIGAVETPRLAPRAGGVLLAPRLAW